MNSDTRKLSNALSGKSARACDNCVRKRARWYCAADDAFLCQSCDLSVHSANPLACRHERVRLKTSSTINPVDETQVFHNCVPSWYQGFTKKARSRRQKRQVNPNSHDLVPEICSEENSHEENEETLLYRVPIFDPFFQDESKVEGLNDFNHLQGFLPSENDLDELTANVESLLGKGFENESLDMEGLGLLDCDDSKVCFDSESVKVEDEEVRETEIDLQFDIGRETFELNFDLDSPITCEVDEESDQIQHLDASKKNFLKLDYEGVISAWDDQKSPWTTGERPEFNSGDCWPPDFSGTSITILHVHEEMGMMGAHATTAFDSGREARVNRYREKRRRRLFSKKIRYEVRKLNAEKRPRMKGRFVKRANFGATASVSAYK